jgi:hypothetical protein
VKSPKNPAFKTKFNKIFEVIFMEMKNSPIRPMEAMSLDPINRIIGLKIVNCNKIIYNSSAGENQEISNNLAKKMT